MRANHPKSCTLVEELYDELLFTLLPASEPSSAQSHLHKGKYVSTPGQSEEDSRYIRIDVSVDEIAGT